MSKNKFIYTFRQDQNVYGKQYISVFSFILISPHIFRFFEYVFTANMYQNGILTSLNTTIQKHLQVFFIFNFMQNIRNIVYTRLHSHANPSILL